MGNNELRLVKIGSSVYFRVGNMAVGDHCAIYRRNRADELDLYSATVTAKSPPQGNNGRLEYTLTFAGPDEDGAPATWTEGHQASHLLLSYSDNDIATLRADMASARIDG